MIQTLAMLVSEAREAGGRETWIYFIEDTCSGATKIGVANDPQGRLNALQTANPNPLRLRALFYAPASLEQILHRELDEDRVGGEWFATEAVAPYADCLQKITVTDARLRKRAERVLGLPLGKRP